MSDADLRALPSLTFELKHDGPVPLGDFTSALQRIAARYARESRDTDEPQLFIQEVRKGSFIVVLISGLTIGAAALGGINQLFKFFENMKGMVNHFTTETEPLEEVTKADCDDMRAIASPVIHTLNGNLTIFYNEPGVPPILLDQPLALIADNRAAMERRALGDKEEGTEREVLLVWDQVRDAPGVDKGRSPDRGIVASIDSRPRQVLFASEELKEQMGRHGLHPFEKAFVVDVRVIAGATGPAAYRVIALHDVIDRE